MDLSVYAVLTNKHSIPADPEVIGAVAEVEQDATPATPDPATPVDFTATNAVVATPDDYDASAAPNYGLWKHTYGIYVVKTVRDPDINGFFLLQIFQGGTLVSSTEAYLFNDPEKDDPDARNAVIPPYSYTNDTGNVVYNLVVTDYSGGAHCCTTYHIFELGDEFHNVDTINAEHGGIVFINLTDSTIPEVQMADWGYAYVFTSFAGSFAPDITLRYTDGKYQIAPELMFTEPPTDDDYTNLVQEVQDAYQPSEGKTEVQSPSIWGGDATLWDKMLDLTYKGHVDLALQLFDIWFDRPSASASVTVG